MDQDPGLPRAGASHPPTKGATEKDSRIVDRVAPRARCHDRDADPGPGTEGLSP